MLDYNFVLKNRIFNGVSSEEGKKFLIESNCHIEKYSKNQLIYMAGDTISEIGIVMQGQILVEGCDEKSNRVIYSTVEKGNHFGDSYAITGLPISNAVTSGTDSQVLYISLEKIKDAENGTVAAIMRNNLLEILAEKNMILSKKIRYTSRKTIRGKVMAYLKEESILKGTDKFNIPFDRQGLADYLNCNRSQLSKELSIMQQEGLIEYNKNYFMVLF